PVERRDEPDGARGDALRVPSAGRPSPRLRLPLPARLARAERRVDRLARGRALAHRRPLRLLAAREGAARAVRRLGVRRLLLAAARRQPPQREPACRRQGQLVRNSVRAQRFISGGAVRGGAARPWYSGPPKPFPFELIEPAMKAIIT